MAKILDHLFLGNSHNAQDMSFLKRHNITHLLCVAGELIEPFPKKFNFKKINAIDQDGFKLFPYFHPATKFIQLVTKAYKKRNHQKRKEFMEHQNLPEKYQKKMKIDDEDDEENEAILVYCSDGKSRAATIVIAYLIKCHKMDCTTALGFVKNKKSNIRPNLGFVVQLKQYEKELMKYFGLQTGYKDTLQDFNENRGIKEREGLYIDKILNTEKDDALYEVLKKKRELIGRRYPAKTSS